MRAMWLALGVIGLLSGCDRGQPHFLPDTEYEEIARGGSVSEENPLLVYGMADPRLIGPRVVVYADHTVPGRIVTVDLLSGEGWEVGGATGDAEALRGETLRFTAREDGFAVYAMGSGRGLVFDSNGMIGESFTVRAGRVPTRERMFRPGGILDDGTFVAPYVDNPPGVGTDSVDAGFVVGERLVPAIKVVAEREVDGSVSAVGMLYDIRGNMIAWAVPDYDRMIRRWIVNGDSIQELPLIEVPYPIAGFLFIDLDSRIWIQPDVERDEALGAPYIVYNPDGSEAYRIQRTDPRDATGDRVLFKDFDDLGVASLVIGRLMPRSR